MNAWMVKGLALTLLAAAAGAPAVAGEENFDIDTRFRSKIAKERVRQGALERAQARNGQDGEDAGPGAGCGSQNIGNIDTGGRAGRGAPREVFIFAPNAINMVSGSGCR